MDVRTPIRAALLSVVPLLIAAPDAQAVTQFASAGVATISPCPSFCGGSGIVTEREFDGPNVSSAFVDFTGVNGSGQARVDLAGQLLLPILGAQASANPNARVGKFRNRALDVRLHRTRHINRSRLHARRRGDLTRRFGRQCRGAGRRNAWQRFPLLHRLRHARF